MCVDIFVVGSKENELQLPPLYKYIRVGEYTGEELNDKTGNSISEKNPFYCELTALYWIWKNYDVRDYIGMCHYRRFFDLTNEGDYEIKNIKKDGYNCKELVCDGLKNEFSNADVILPVPKVFNKTAEESYKTGHRKEDFDVMKKIIHNRYPEYDEAVDSFCTSYKYSLYNMFIMKKDIFYDYMDWLFSILFEAEKYIKIPYDDKYQRRIFGFLAERLLNIYVQKNNLRVKYKPIIFLGDKSDSRVKKFLKKERYKFRTNWFFLYKALLKFNVKI